MIAPTHLRQLCMLEEPHCLAYLGLLPHTAIIYECWVGATERSATWKEINDHGMDLLDQHLAEAWVVNVLHLENMPQAANEWIVEWVLPQLQRKGLRYLATVLPADSLHAEAAVNQWAQQAGLAAREFTTEPAALAWVHEKLGRNP